MKLKVSAIICAAGSGQRAGFGKNKLLAPLYGAPALYHTFRKFQLPEIDEVVVSSSERDREEISALAAPFGYRVVTGGATRTESVKNALAAVSGDVVLIHDGARPYLSHALIARCIEEVAVYKSAVCAVRSTDTVVFTDGFERPDREKLYLVQTPQAFFTEDIKKAYSLAGEKIYTDDSAVYGEFIGVPHLTEGERQNIKLTYPEDFLRELPAVTAGEGQRVGFGVDVHAFGKGNGVTLAGVKIACDRTLIAHSDGDVVFHAVIDALLSAAGLRDIGCYFPDSDETYRNADSGKLLQETVRLVRLRGFVPANLSIAIQAETPKLAPHIPAMIKNLCAACGIAEENAAIAAGTCEGLGFIGERLGIAAYCTVLLKNADPNGSLPEQTEK